MWQRLVEGGRLVLALSLFTFAAGCVSAAPTASGVIDLADRGGEELRLVYLGNGGWIIERGEDLVLTGPLFSNPSVLEVGLGRVRSDTVLVDRYLGRYDVSRAEAILVGHAHYDHLLDVPRAAAVHAPDARILGSRTVANLLGSWSGLEDRIDVVDDLAGDVDHPGRWIRYGDVRVMAIRSHHGPHFAGINLFRGSADEPRATEPERAAEWVDGATYAFLLDFLTAQGSVAFRVFYQDAVAEPPFGLAPTEVVAERSVDVAILVAPTFGEVEWHPESVVANLDPRFVLLGHWENFFAPVDEPIRPIALTDHREFDVRLERVFGGPWWRPARWTEFRFGPT